MAETEKDDTKNLNDIIQQQSKTIKTLVDEVEGSATDPPNPLFNTTPTTTEKPKNFVTFILIGVVAILAFRLVRRK